MGLRPDGHRDHNGLGRLDHPSSVLASLTGDQMNLTPQKALKIFWTLSIKKQADLLHQFAMMAQGGHGPWIPGGYPRVRVREYYYSDWSNEDFQWVIDRVDQGA